MWNSGNSDTLSVVLSLATMLLIWISLYGEETKQEGQIPAKCDIQIRF